MSKKTETKTTNQYDSASMNQYHTNHGNATNVFSDYMKDPLKASYFQNQVNILNRASNQIGQRNVSNLLNNQNLTGGGVMPGYMSSMLARTGRDTGAMQAQNFLGALMQAEQNRRGAASAAFQDRPLQTGQNSVQTTSGVGTWLPQVIGAGLSGLAAVGTGGASLAATGLQKGLSIGSAVGGSLMSGFAGSNPGGNNNPSYFGFNDYQQPLQQFSFGQGTPYQQHY